MSGAALSTADQQSQLTIIEGLACSALCRGLTHTEVATLADGATLRQYRPLNEAIAEGQSANYIEVVLSGRFIVLLPTQHLDERGHGAVVDLHTFVPGDCFGEQALVNDQTACASIIASERSLTVSLRASQLDSLLKRHPALGRKVYRNLFRISAERSRQHYQ